MPAPATFNTPGRWGVNEQEKNQLLNPNWATKADGLVINDGGQLQCRGALDLVTTDGAHAEILRQFAYVTAAGVETVISTTATKIVSGVGDLDDASTDVTSSTTPTNGFWQFVNFNGKVLGWQAGHAPIVKTSADFADIAVASGTLPDGDCACAAFGRVWAVDDDGQTVRISALLDETKWDAADGGASIDMRNVWTKGMDRVTAIAAIGSNLVIFGRRHIIIYTDSSGSVLGLDPETMYVVDTIEGTGCVARDSVASVGEGDLVFLSEVGLQSLGRVIQSKDNPLVTISWQIADRITAAIKAEVASATDLRTWTGHYIPATKQYMLVDTTNEDVYVFHTSGRTQDDQGRLLVPITIWDTSILTNIRGFITLRSGVTYTTGSATHEIYKYDTSLSLDEGSAAIAVTFESGWLDLQDPSLKLLKMAQLTVLNPAGIDSAQTLRYAADYSTMMDTLTPVYTSDDARVVTLYDPSGDIEGQYFKIGFSDTSFGRKVLTQIQLQFKPGRTAFIHKKFGDVADEEVETSGPALIGVYTGTMTTLNGVTTGSTTIALPVLATTDVVFWALIPNRNQSNTPSFNYGQSNADFFSDPNAIFNSPNNTLFFALVDFSEGAPTDQSFRVNFLEAVSGDTIWTIIACVYRGGDDSGVTPYVADTNGASEGDTLALDPSTVGAKSAVVFLSTVTTSSDVDSVLFPQDASLTAIAENRTELVNGTFSHTVIYTLEDVEAGTETWVFELGGATVARMALTAREATTLDA